MVEKKIGDIRDSYWLLDEQSEIIIEEIHYMTAIGNDGKKISFFSEDYYSDLPNNRAADLIIF